jgi:hypothetical protein
MNTEQIGIQLTIEALLFGNDTDVQNLQITISVELYSNEQIVLSIYDHNTPPISFFKISILSRSFLGQMNTEQIGIQATRSMS